MRWCVIFPILYTTDWCGCLLYYVMYPLNLDVRIRCFESYISLAPYSFPISEIHELHDRLWLTSVGNRLYTAYSSMVIVLLLIHILDRLLFFYLLIISATFLTSPWHNHSGLESDLVFLQIIAVAFSTKWFFEKLLFETFNELRHVLLF